MRTHNFRKQILSFIVFAGILLGSQPAHALPQFLMRFSQDPFSRPEFRGQCSTCHINPNGGGPRNPFGTAFEANDHVITPEFRAAWPDHFLPSAAAAPLASSVGEVKATFLASETETILEISGEYFRLNGKQAKLEKLDSQQAAQLISAPPAAAGMPEEPRLPLREQPTVDHYLVTLPTTLPYGRGACSRR
ncbi:MAG: hypothetical protein HYX73_02785, partial [Acidobacteria bacterium]|nr:hypothetical protein [Acidobacteriota bacterium]